MSQQQLVISLGEVESRTSDKVKRIVRMPLTVLTQEQTKNLLRQVLVELLEERRAEFHELIVEAIEEVALARAIRTGRKNEFVSEDQIRAVLEA